MAKVSISDCILHSNTPIFLKSAQNDFKNVPPLYMPQTLQHQNLNKNSPILTWSRIQNAKILIHPQPIRANNMA